MRTNAPQNKRGEARRVRKHEAWVLTEAGARECRVVNVSLSGATLTIRDRMPLPKQFCLKSSLYVAGRNCELVWRRGPTAGIKFVP
jgi:hypothetical protein